MNILLENDMNKELDCLGNPLTPEQVNFFKDSKIRGRNNQLQVCYHATAATFDAFDKGKIGSGNGGASFGKGFYFATYEDLAGDYDGNVGEYYLNITNPFNYYDTSKSYIVDVLNKSNYKYDKEFVDSYDYDELWDVDLIDDFLRRALIDADPYVVFSEMVANAGYDGIVAGSEIIAFEPNQIKSITNRTPTNSNNLNESSIQDERAVWGLTKDCLEDDLPLMTYDEFAELLKEQGMTPTKELYQIMCDAYNDAGKSGEADINKIISEFKKMSSDEMINLLGIPNSIDIDINAPMFLLPNGAIISVEQVGKLNNIVLKDSVHSDIIYVIFTKIAEKLGMDYDDTVGEVDEINYINPLTYRLNWARLNCGNTWTEGRFYCVLPNHMTSAQYRSLETWLEWGADNKDSVLVFVGSYEDNQTYYFNETFPEDIIKKIKRYYSSGRLYENRNELKEEMNGPYIELDDTSLVDELGYAGATEIKGKKVYGDETTLRQLINELEFDVDIINESSTTNDDGIVTQSDEDRFTVTTWKGNRVLYSGNSFEDAKGIYHQANAEGDYCSLNDKAGRYQQNHLNEDNELEQRAKKHRKKSKGMGWHMSFNAGDVEKGIEVFNNSTSLGTSGGEGTAMGESIEENIYYYDGPVYYDGRKIASKSDIYTKAKSFNVAARNILFKSANGDDELYHYEIVDDMIKQLPKNETPKVRPKCQTCGYELNDLGDCPVCDYGEDDLLEDLSSLEALWQLSKLD